MKNPAFSLIQTIRDLLVDPSFLDRHRTAPTAFSRKRKLPFASVVILVLQKTVKSIRLHLHEFFARLSDGLVLTSGATGSGDLIVDWAPARRATGYRVKAVVAGEPTPRLFGLFPDDQTALAGLPIGSLLTVTIIAHNEAGDSQESTPATTTLV